MNMNRRTVVRGAAWTAPVIAVMAAAPAYAASQDCQPEAKCKLQGEGQNTKDYLIATNCANTGGGIKRVEVYDDKNKSWINATQQDGGDWLAEGFNDSRGHRFVRITSEGSNASSGDDYSMQYTVRFPPC